MPYKTERACKIPRCPNPAEPGTIYCAEHKQQQSDVYNIYIRDKELKNLYSKKNWRDLRARKIAASPICEICLIKGVVKAGEFVHHIKPVTGATDIITTLDKLQTTCRACHERQHKRGFIKHKKK